MVAGPWPVLTLCVSLLGLAHISPAHSENINFFGAIEVDIEGELAQLGPTGHRPLEALYTISVSPAPRRLTYDGVCLIVVGDGTWQESFDSLWELLVWGRGKPQRSKAR